MSARSIASKIGKHANDFNYLRQSGGKVQKAVLSSSNASLIKAIVLIAGNILNGTIKLTKEEHQQLQKYASAIRKLVHGSRDTSARRAVLIRHTNQQGGFLGFLIKPLVSLVGSLIGGIGK